PAGTAGAAATGNRRQAGNSINGPARSTTRSIDGRVNLACMRQVRRQLRSATSTTRWRPDARALSHSGGRPPAPRLGSGDTRRAAEGAAANGLARCSAFSRYGAPAANGGTGIVPTWAALPVSRAATRRRRHPLQGKDAITQCQGSLVSSDRVLFSADP